MAKKKKKLIYTRIYSTENTGVYYLIRTSKAERDSGKINSRLKYDRKKMARVLFSHKSKSKK